MNETLLRFKAGDFYTKEALTTSALQGFLSFIDDPALKSNNENHQTITTNDILPKDKDANEQKLWDESQSTSQAPDTESEVMQIISPPLDKKSDEISRHCP